MLLAKLKPTSCTTVICIFPSSYLGTGTFQGQFSVALVTILLSDIVRNIGRETQEHPWMSFYSKLESCHGVARGARLPSDTKRVAKCCKLSHKAGSRCNLSKLNRCVSVCVFQRASERDMGRSSQQNIVILYTINVLMDFHSLQCRGGIFQWIAFRVTQP